MKSCVVFALLRKKGKKFKQSVNHPPLLRSPPLESEKIRTRSNIRYKSTKEPEYQIHHLRKSRSMSWKLKKRKDQFKLKPPLCIGWRIFKWSFQYMPPFIIYGITKLKTSKISQTCLHFFYIFVGSKRNRF